MRQFLGALRHPRDYEWLSLRPFQRHSLVLLIAGTVYIGLGVVYTCTDPSADRIRGMGWALDVVPLKAWGGVWMVVGTLVVLSSRWPPASKKWGYSLLTLLSLCWSLIFLFSVVVFGTGESGLTGAFVWGLMSFLWWAIAGLTNPDDLIDMVDRITPSESVLPENL